VLIGMENLSEQELREIAAMATARADRLNRRLPREQMHKMLEQYLDDHGWTFDELMELPGASRNTSKIPLSPPRYRDPSVPLRTWSGRGRKPKWVLAWEEGGVALEDLRVGKSSPITSNAKD
jgi:DNA-binding protein H-NS